MNHVYKISNSQGLKEDGGSSRRYYLDILKIIAIYLVMLNHTGQDGYYLFAESLSSRWYGLYLFISMGIKIAVPIFFMVSGSLLLAKTESYSDLLRKRFGKYFLVLVVFSFLQYLWSIGFQFVDISISDFVAGFYSKPYAATYWYLYAYLAMLLMLPLLRKLVVGMSNIDFLWLFILRVLTVSVFPLFQYFVWNDGITLYHEFNVVIAVEDTMFYPLIGYYLDKRLDIAKFTKIRCVICSAISIVLLFGGCVLTHIYGIHNGDLYVDNFRYMFDFFPAMTFFVQIKKIVSKCDLNVGVANSIRILGSTVFGIMLLEAPIRNKTEFICDVLQAVMGPMLACMLWILTCLVIGVIVTLILKCVPLVRRLL